MCNCSVHDFYMQICVTTSTSAGLEQILPWMFYHKVIGVSTFFLFVEGKAASPQVSKVLESIAVSFCLSLWLIWALQSLFCSICYTTYQFFSPSVKLENFEMVLVTVTILFKEKTWLTECCFDNIFCCLKISCEALKI